MDAIYNITRFTECPEIKIPTNENAPIRVFGTYRIDGPFKNGIAAMVRKDFAAAGFAKVNVAVGEIDATDAKAEIMVSIIR